jgi:hypothetical protein
MDSEASSSGTSTIPSELRGQLPRRTRLSGNSSLRVLVASVFLALGTAGAIWGGKDSLQQAQDKTAIRLGGVNTDASITKLGSEGNSSTITARYSFTVNGENFTGHAVVPESLYSGLLTSASLPILYLPSNPSVNHPAAWEWSAGSVWDSMLVPVIFVTGSLMSLLLMRTQRTLVAKGIPVTAVTTACSRGRGGGFIVRYDFRTEDGGEFKGSGWCESPQVLGGKIPVLYLPHYPKRNQPYPLAYYRVAH